MAYIGETRGKNTKIDLNKITETTLDIASFLSSRQVIAVSAELHWYL